MGNLIGVLLVFSADTAKAKSQLQDLDKTLTNITHLSAIGKEDFKLTKDLAEAQKTAVLLKMALRDAVDTDTGNINIEKFNKTLKTANMSAEKIKNTLTAIGPEGQRAFIGLTRSVASAEAPLKRVDSLLNKMWGTMKNTMKWLISSSVLHGLMSSFSGAFSYAEDLNKSLNNIRIVSGASKEEMAQFAVEANNAAKALDTTTVAYTDAALIYYQQGLKGEDVKKRADTTVQLSNISGDSVEEVSNQLTAIWNNFYDGSKSLEYYADVLTALGAATASSSDEIAGGLERFSSIADTVGLSYEYASSALATITSVTRQSEDVVGTALKTIFARIQGLKLGETLEDGTTLNKYSEALQNVGISIFDSNNELKNMDAILEEMGAKWQTLSKDQRVALAQSVAGVRQYNQLMSLMDNWDVFEQNLSVAQGATGALQEQAEIYSESWEAAAKNVKAATQDVFDSLINDDFFITLLNGLEDIINVTGSLIDGMNGLPGLFTLIGGIGLKVFSKLIAGSIDSALKKFMQFADYTKHFAESGMTVSLYVANKLQVEKLQITDEFLQQAETIKLSPSLSAGIKIEATALAMQRSLAKQYDRGLVTQDLTDELNLIILLYREYGGVIEEINLKYEDLSHIIDRINVKVQSQIRRDKDKATEQELNQLNQKNNKITSAMGILLGGVNKEGVVSKDFIRSRTKLDTVIDSVPEHKKEKIENLINLRKKLNDIAYNSKKYEQKDGKIKLPNKELEEFESNIKKIYYELNQLQKDNINNLRTKLNRDKNMSPELRDEIEDLLLQKDNQADLILLRAVTQDGANKIVDEYAEKAEQIKKNIASIGQVALRAGSGVNDLVFGINGMIAAVNAFKDDDLSGFEKFLVISTSLATSLGGVTSGIYELNEAIGMFKGTEVFTNLASSVNDIDIKKSSKKITAKDLGKNAILEIGVISKKVFSSIFSWGKAIFSIAKRFVPVIFGIGVVLYGVVKIVSTIWEKIDGIIHAEENAVEKSTLTAEELNSAYESITEKHQTMVEELSNYDKAKEELLQLTKGTKEYEEALNKANASALVLISNLNDLSKEDYHYNEEGLLEISQEALDRAELVDEQRVALVGRAQARSKVELAQDKTELQEKQVYNEVALSKAVNRFDLDEELKQLILNNPQILEMDTENLANLLYSKDHDGDLGKNKNYESEDYLNYEHLAEALLENKSSLLELNSSVESANDLIEILNANNALLILQEEGYDIESDNGELLFSASASTYEIGYEKAEKRLLLNFETSYRNYFSLYAEIMGLDSRAISTMDFDSNTSKISYKDALGEEVTVSAEAITTVLAEAEAKEYLIQNTEVLTSKLEELNSGVGVTAQKGVADFIATKDFSKANLAEIKKMKLEAEKGEKAIDEILGLTGDTVKDEEIARSYGYESVKALKEAYLEGIKEAGNWVKDLPKDIQSSKYLEGLTLESATELANNYNSILGTRNKEDFKKNIDIIGNQTELDANELERVNELINTLDWSHYDKAIEEVTEELEEMGVTSEEAILAVGKLGSSIQKNVGTSKEELDSILQSYSQIKDITDKLAESKTGIISDEDYELLVAYNKELEKYFVTLADGSHILIGDKLDLTLEIEEKKNNTLKNRISTNQEKIKLQNLKEELPNFYSPTTSLAGSTFIEPYLRESNNVELVESSLQLLEALGESKDQIDEWHDALFDSSGKLKEVTAETDHILYQINKDLFEFDKGITKMSDLERQELEKETLSEMNALAIGMDYKEATEARKKGEINDKALSVSGAVRTNKDKWENVEVEEVQLYADYLEDIGAAAEDAGRSLDEENKIVNKNVASLDDLTEATEDMALSIVRMNKGIEALASGWEDWGDILTNSSEDSLEFAEAMTNTKAALSDVLGVQEDFISNDFVKNHLEEIGLAAQGDAEAINNLKMAMAEDIIMSITLDGSDIQQQALNLHNELINLIPDLEMGAYLDEGNFLEAALNLIDTASMTQEEAQAYFDSIGFTPIFETKEEEVTDYVPETRTYITGFNIGSLKGTGKAGGKEEWGVAFDSKTVQVGEAPVTHKMHVPVIGNDGSPVLKGLASNGGHKNHSTTMGSKNNFSSRNSGGPKPSGGGGGGKDKEPTPAEKMDKTERDKIVDRYYEITKAIEIMTDALSDASKATDRLYGKKRIAAMKKEQELTKASINLLKLKKKEAQSYLQSDKSKLLNNDYGIDFNLDKDGNITNYTNVLNSLFNQLSAAEDTYNSFGTKEEQDKYKESTLDPLNKKIDKVKELTKLYDDTRKELMDIDNEILDKMYEIQDRNYEIITYKVELQIEVNDMELKKLDYFIHKYEDDFYKMAESQALLGDSFPLLTNNLATYKGEVDELTKAYNNNEISQAKYIEGLKEINEKVLDNMTSLIDLDREMLEYYNKTLDGVEDKFKKATDMVEHQLDVLEHYKKTIDLLNKLEDYNLVNNVLNNLFKAVTNLRRAQEDFLTMLYQQRKKIEQDIANSTGKEQEGYKKQLEDLIPRINETENAVNGLSESLAELSNEILDNDLKKLNKDFEAGILKSLGLEDMDDYLEKIDRLKAKQEEYLTDTNKVYEVNKLMRKVKLDLVKTDSEAAKAKYNEYLKSVEALGKQNRLSKYELEIAQARYQVLQALMALEEAKNAKDAMRLVRDSSGNWNYVYTANQDKIDESQLLLEDALNNLYNIGLQGAQDYQDKYTSVMRDFIGKYKELVDLYRQGEIASEDEFNLRVLEAKDDYYNLLKDISELYHIGHDLMVDESINKEADYILLGITNLEDFKFATDTNLNETNNAFDRWRENSKLALGDVASNIDILSSQIEENAKLTENLVDLIEDGLLPTLENELDEVRDTTEIWLSHRDALYETMEAYEDLLGHILHTVEDAAGVKPGGILPDIPEKYKQDYSALMANYISKGNKVGDAVWNQLFAQREEKIKWLAANGYSSDYWGTSGTATKNKFEDIQAGKGDMAWYNAAKNIYSELQIKEILRKIGISEFRTGGYTGEWGSQGKLGVLHEKELVLNELDTKNILQSIDLTNAVNSKNNKISIALQGMVSEFFNKYKGLFNNTEEKTQEIQQKVSIEANFPGVSVASEIEEAFNDLVNQASQYATRSKRLY